MTALLVANYGGHISELWALANRLDDEQRVWITNDHSQTRHILADEKVEFVPFIDARDAVGVLRALPNAFRYLRANKVDRVISTGAAIAVAWLPVAAALRIPAHYIESTARTQAPSLTGKILARVPGVTMWWQYDDAPQGWRSLAGLFSRYSTEPVEAPVKIERILVTVGTTEYSFARLIKRLVEIIPDHVEVVWQTGHTDVSNLGIEGHTLMPSHELIAETRKADVVISHAGAGSLFNCLDLGQVPVYVPRRGERGEHVDDHQTELAQWAHDAGLAITIDASSITWSDLEQAASLRATAQPAEPLLLDPTT